jgi:hypothetical protein
MIEHREIDGRPASVVYLDEDMAPAERDDATIVKILFDDGEIKWLVADDSEDNDEDKEDDEEDTDEDEAEDSGWKSPHFRKI